MLQHFQSSLVASAMTQIGQEGWRVHPIEQFIPLALRPDSDLIVKRLIMLLFASRNNPDDGLGDDKVNDEEFVDQKAVEKIIVAMANQDPTAAFTALFQAYDISLDHPDVRRQLPRHTFVFVNALPLVALLPEKDIPSCAAFVFDAALFSPRGEPPDHLVRLAHAILDRLDQSFPGEADRLFQYLRSKTPSTPLVEQIFEHRQPKTPSTAPLRVRVGSDHKPK
jgi:hypothetical protein